jgi:hypothetical protein
MKRSRSCQVGYSLVSGRGWSRAPVGDDAQAVHPAKAIIELAQRGKVLRAGGHGASNMVDLLLGESFVIGEAGACAHPEMRRVLVGIRVGEVVDIGCTDEA